MSCSHFEGISTAPESGSFRLCDRIIKPGDIHVSPDVKSHDFPDFTAERDTAGGLVANKATAFQPETFCADQDAAACTNGFSEPCASHAGTQGGSPSAGEGTEPIRQLLNQVQQAILAMETVARDVDREMERTVGLLALGLAEIMVNHTVETNPDVVLSSLAKALQRGQGREIRKIRMNPVDIEQTDRSRKNPSGLVEPFEDIRLEADVALARGGCVVETDYGTIDASPENQFRVLLDAFRSVADTARRD